MTAPALPTHETVFRRLRDMVLFGELAPGAPVTLHGLVARTGTSTTPVREAVRRLTAAGALELHGNRRVSVPVIDAARLDELEFARLAVEPEMARRAAARLPDRAFAELSAIDDALDTAIREGDVPGYLRGNWRFHFTLYGHAGAPVLLALAESLWLRYGPASRVICGRFGTAGMPDRHDEALAALAAGHAAAAGAAIAADIRQGFALMRAGLAQGDI